MMLSRAQNLALHRKQLTRRAAQQRFDLRLALAAPAYRSAGLGWGRLWGPWPSWVKPVLWAVVPVAVYVIFRHPGGLVGAMRRLKPIWQVWAILRRGSPV